MRLCYIALIAMFCTVMKAQVDLSENQHGTSQQQEVMKYTLPFLQKTLLRIYREIKSDPQFLEFHISKEDTEALLDLVNADRIPLSDSVPTSGVSTYIPEILVTVVSSLILTQF